MAAYVVFTRERTRDDDEMRKYADRAVPTLRDHPVRQLAFYGALAVVEGRALEGAAILWSTSSQS